MGDGSLLGRYQVVGGVEAFFAVPGDDLRTINYPAQRFAFLGGERLKTSIDKVVRRSNQRDLAQNLSKFAREQNARRPVQRVDYHSLLGTLLQFPGGYSRHGYADEPRIIFKVLRP